jgi:DNA-binding response OmpR family regulator
MRAILYYIRAMPQRILVIEDDPAFRKTLCLVLAEAGYDASPAPSGKAGLVAALDRPPDLVLLDLVLPGIKGMEVCAQLKEWEQTAAVPVLILTGSDKEGQDIACLDVGADGYLTKPVKTERLLAHCRALLRRPGASKEKPLKVGALALDYAKKLVVLDGKKFPNLTPMEFGLLYELAARSPEPLDRTDIYKKVWGLEPPSEGSLKTVDVHARRVRLKLGWDADEWLTYVHGRGYRLAAP